MLKMFDRLEELVAVALLAGTVGAVLVGAIGRSVGHPVPAGPEIAQLLLIWTCMSAAVALARAFPPPHADSAEGSGAVA